MNKDPLLDAVPLYVEKYGLSVDPFATEAVPIEFIYRSTARAHQLNFLQHLCQFSQYILAVMGPEGSGKTTLKREFIHEAKGQLKICDLRAQEVHSVPVLLQTIAQRFDLPWDDEENHLDKAVAETLTQDWRPWVIVVDDAESLRADVLEALLKLLRSHTMRGEPLHLVLLGEPALQNLLNLAPVAELCQDALHRLDLEVLEEQELGPYVNFALQKGGYRGECPLSLEVLHQIYQESKGLYSETNRLIRQYLTLGLRKPLRQGASAGLFSSFKKQTAWVTGLAVVGLGFYITSDNLSSFLPAETTETQTITFNTGATEQTVAAATETLQVAPNQKMEETTLAVASNNIEASPEAAESESLTSELASMIDSASQSSAMLAEKIVPENIDVAVMPETTLPTLKPEEVSMSAAAKTAASTETKVAQAEGNQQEASPQKKLIKEGANKAKARTKQTDITTNTNNAYNRGHYTLQLMGLSDKSRLKQLLATHHDKNLSYYETARDGKPWYVVIYGDYADSKKAKLAAGQLPAALKQGNPWPRTFASIEKEKKSNHP